MLHRTLLLSVIACSLIALPAPAATFTISGSKTMYALNTALAAEFEKSHASVELRVLDEGTTRGIEGLMAGRIDAAASTRPLTKKESDAARKRFGKELVSTVLALEGVSIYLHPRNRVSTLTVEQIRAILTGRTTNWKDVGGVDAPIRVHSFSDHTGRYYFMVENVMGGAPFAKGTRYCSEDPKLAPHKRLADEERQMLDAVSDDPHAIGYGDLKKVRVVKIARVLTADGAYLPTPEHVQTGRYPLSRRLMLFVRPDAARPLHDFVRWAPTRGDIVRELNFAPVQ